MVLNCGYVDQWSYWSDHGQVAQVVSFAAGAVNGLATEGEVGGADGGLRVAQAAAGAAGYWRLRCGSSSI